MTHGYFVRIGAFDEAASRKGCWECGRTGVGEYEEMTVGSVDVGH